MAFLTSLQFVIFVTITTVFASSIKSEIGNIHVLFFVRLIEFTSFFDVLVDVVCRLARF